MIRVGIIINGTRPLQDKAREALRLIEGSEYLIPSIRTTEFSKHAIEIARQWAHEKEVLIAVGGDGTSHEVLNGWHQSGAIHCALGIIPNGTGNDFFAMLPVFDPVAFVRNLEVLDVQHVDYGIGETAEDEIAFLNVSDVGFGAKVVQLLNKQRAIGLKGKSSYAMAILRAFFVFRKREIALQLDGQHWKGKVLLVAFCNGSTFGHGLTIHPGTRLNDGHLGITIVGDVSLLTYASKLKQLKTGSRIEHEKLHYMRVNQIEFSMLPPGFFVEFDGEICKKAIQKIRIQKEQLPLIC